jgi:hypothetical protein
MRYPFEIIDKAKKSTEQTKIVQQSYHGTLRNEKGAFEKYYYFGIAKNKTTEDGEIPTGFLSKTQIDYFNTVFFKRKKSTKFNELFKQKFLIATLATTVESFFNEMENIQDDGIS